MKIIEERNRYEKPISGETGDVDSRRHNYSPFPLNGLFDSESLIPNDYLSDGLGYKERHESIELLIGE